MKCSNHSALDMGAMWEKQGLDVWAEASLQKSLVIIRLIKAKLLVEDLVCYNALPK